MEKEITEVGKNAKLTAKEQEEKYKNYENNMVKYSDEIPKIE